MGKKVRDSNIELLRILASLGVILLHYNGQFAFSLVNQGSVNDWILQGMEALFVCAVDLFVLISGYFSCTTNRRKTVKIFELLFQVTVVSTGWYLVSSVLNHTPVTLRGFAVSLVPNSYFVTIYLALYILSPYLNRSVEKIDAKKFRTLLGVCLVLFSVLPTVLDASAEYGYSFTGLYPMSFSGSAYGYTLVQFTFMYLIGAYLRRFSSESNPAKKRSVWLTVFFLSFVAVYFWQFWSPWIARSYCNPFVILLAVSVFMLFRSISLQSRVVNLLAKGSFTVFLLHPVFLPYVGIGRVVNGNPLLLLGHALLTAVGIFLLCWMGWFLYDLLTRPLWKVLGKCLAPLDAKLSLEDAERGPTSKEP